ncbi:DUF4625 domain-containing protein [Sphingobacterium sp.]|uniref:DUF4625 domain-containing protein n=1 Tax=Sphingobacterium sp. TaxID=341027 RepID=UPI0028AD3BDE|nr:DUF4625 domain-containing protein [Sphingobacterium sp.]
MNNYLKMKLFNMKALQKYTLIAVLFVMAAACKKDKESIDTEKPSIAIDSDTAFPIQCSTIKRGTSFTFRSTLADNVALGSYSIDVHHNFDHHSHSTEIGECTIEAIKTPIKPFVLVKTVNIPGQPQQYNAELKIDVPADIDPGNYHFMIQVTDLAGWSTQKGISIRILE